MLTPTSAFKRISTNLHEFQSISKRNKIFKSKSLRDFKISQDFIGLQRLFEKIPRDFEGFPRFQIYQRISRDSGEFLQI